MRAQTFLNQQVPMLYLLPSKPFRIHCTKPGCAFCASATTEGQAINMLASHLLSPVHVAWVKK